MTKLKKQLLASVCCILLLALLGVAYFFLIQEPDSAKEKVEYGKFGETMKNGRPFIVDEVPNDSLNHVFVKNKHDSYKMIRKKSGAYKIEGLEDYELNEQMMPLLRVNTLHLLALGYVEDADMENLSLYGIDKDNPEVYFEVVHNHEFDSYKILVGDKTPDEKGYYAMLDGRDALYILDAGIESSVLLPRQAYITPRLATPVEENSRYSLKEFTLFKEGEQFIKIEKSTGDKTYGNNATHRLTYPAYNYSVNLTNFSTFLEKISGMTGTQTLLYGDKITPEALSEIGFFDENGKDVSDFSFTFSFPTSSGEIYVLKEENDFVVYSKKANIVSRVAFDSLSFLEWDILEWISSEIFMLDIDDVSQITFEADGKVADFTLEKNDASLTVKVGGKVVDTNKFRDIYKSIMYILVTSPTDNTPPQKEQLRMTVRTLSGEMLEYVFYYHSAFNSYYTLNGFGEFYVSRDKIEALKDSAFNMIY